MAAMGVLCEPLDLSRAVTVLAGFEKVSSVFLHLNEHYLFQPCGHFGSNYLYRAEVWPHTGYCIN